MTETRLVAMTDEHHARLRRTAELALAPTLVAELDGIFAFGITEEEARVTIDELDAMGHSKPGEHEGPVDERCPACDGLDKLRAVYYRKGHS